jgi:hypothetical protein
MRYLNGPICFAVLSLAMSLGSAHAELQADAGTPENDLVDTTTGLAWIKVSSLQQGESLGYRQATSLEAWQLPIASEQLGGIFSLGVDASIAPSPQSPHPFRSQTSFGKVLGPEGQSWIAGYYFESQFTGFSNHSDAAKLVSTPDKFADVVRPELFIGRLSSNVGYGDDLTTRTAASSGGTRAYWHVDLDLPENNAKVGYFMVRAAVPEPASILTWSLGLVAMLAVVRRQRNVKAASRA